MDYQQKILSLASISPLQPVRVAKELNISSIIASAMLSELKEKGKLFVSFLKVGSSPLYYLPEKKHLLENYSASLNEKEKITYELLKKEEVIQDSKQDPLTRVCLRQIKDFAEPIQASYDGRTELFWKWYNLPKESAEQKINAVIESKIQEQKKNEEEKINEIKEDLIDKSKKSRIKKLTEFEDEFIDYLEKNNARILEVLSKKSKERDLLIEINSSFGKLNYFCKIKDKKVITESDVNNAFMQAQIKKLPLLILSKGILSKKTEKLLEELKGVVFQKI